MTMLDIFKTKRRNRSTAVGLLLVATLASAPSIVMVGPASAATTGDITLAQTDLNGLAYQAGTVDGLAGPATAAAVRAFQADRCLSVDGVIGPQTLAGLKSVVETVQTTAGSAADGDYGPNTTAAVQSYQSAHHLAADGIAGPNTMASMGIARQDPACHGSGGGGGTDVQARVVTDAQAVARTGLMPYSWDGGHAAKPGPSYGSCVGYTGSIRPCPASSTIGVDCSGFTRWMYAEAAGYDYFGISNTDTQIARGTPVSRSNAVPGDLVFFGSSTSHTEHVGVYIGLIGGVPTMIDAPFTGVYVRQEPVSNASGLLGYYHYNVH